MSNEIPKLNDKTIILKDMTQITSTVKETLEAMRSAYDGISSDSPRVIELSQEQRDSIAKSLKKLSSPSIRKGQMPAD